MYAMYELLQSALAALARGIGVTDRPEARTGSARDALRWAEAVLQAQTPGCGDDVRALALLTKAAALAVLCDFQAAAESAGEATQELWMLAEAAGRAAEQQPEPQPEEGEQLEDDHESDTAADTGAEQPATDEHLHVWWTVVRTWSVVLRDMRADLMSVAMSAELTGSVERAEAERLHSILDELRDALDSMMQTLGGKTGICAPETGDEAWERLRQREELAEQRYGDSPKDAGWQPKS